MIMTNVKRLLTALLFVAIPVTCSAQQTRPGAFTKVTITDVTANALHVGCPVTNVTNCIGGIKAGPLVIAGSYTVIGDSVYDIGEAAFRIRKVWTTDLDVAGTLTAGSVAATSLSCTGCVGATQIAATAVSAGSYGSSTAVGTFTVDADGRLTAAANVTPQLTLSGTYFSSLDGSSVTGSPTFTNLAWSTAAVFSWNVKATATNFTAASDGFLVGIVDCSGGGGCAGSLVLLSDTSATPTTMRGAANAPDGQIQSAMIPVRKTDKYRVNTTTGAGAPVFTVYWVPMGTGG